MKKCARCGIEKSYEDFHKRSLSLDGYQRLCKCCIKEYRAELNQKNPGREAEIEKRRYYKHKEKRNALSREWSAKNREARMKYNRAYYDENKERLCAMQRAWNAENSAHASFLARQRKKHIAIATPSWANLDAIKSIYLERSRKSRRDGMEYHVDHIIPLRGKLVCGLHVENNLRIITSEENLKKNCRFSPE